MLYSILKVTHIIFASLLFATMLYNIFLWLKQTADIHSILARSTAQLIIPLTILQLLSGFTIISLKHYDFHEKWILVSSIGFPLFIASWLGFVYFSSFSFRRVPLIMLGFTFLSLLLMIFFMTNKIA
jgi:uncharacterized membrane protein YozB (DUF420 family)